MKKTDQNHKQKYACLACAGYLRSSLLTLTKPNQKYFYIQISFVMIQIRYEGNHGKFISDSFCRVQRF